MENLCNHREDAKVELQQGARLLDRVSSDVFQSRQGGRAGCLG